MFNFIHDHIAYEFEFFEFKHMYSGTTGWYFTLYSFKENIDSAYQIVNCEIENKKIKWSKAHLTRSSGEDGIWIPDAVLEYINHCCEKFFKLLVFS